VHTFEVSSYVRSVRACFYPVFQHMSARLTTNMTQTHPPCAAKRNFKSSRTCLIACLPACRSGRSSRDSPPRRRMCRHWAGHGSWTSLLQPAVVCTSRQGRRQQGQGFRGRGGGRDMEKVCVGTHDKSKHSNDHTDTTHRVGAGVCAWAAALWADAATCQHTAQVLVCVCVCTQGTTNQGDHSQLLHGRGRHRSR
jgi:hypothetical protein